MSLPLSENIIRSCVSIIMVNLNIEQNVNLKCLVELENSTTSVSYTHLDVYKRQT